MLKEVMPPLGLSTGPQSWIQTGFRSPGEDGDRKDVTEMRSIENPWFVLDAPSAFVPIILGCFATEEEAIEYTREHGNNATLICRVTHYAVADGSRGVGSGVQRIHPVQY